MSQYPARRRLENLADLLAEVDLLETLLTGLISSHKQSGSCERGLVEEQFKLLEREFARLGGLPRLDDLAKYSSQLKEEYSAYIQQLSTS